MIICNNDNLMLVGRDFSGNAKYGIIVREVYRKGEGHETNIEPKEGSPKVEFMDNIFNIDNRNTIDILNCLYENKEMATEYNRKMNSGQYNDFVSVVKYVPEKMKHGDIVLIYKYSNLRLDEENVFNPINWRMGYASAFRVSADTVNKNYSLKNLATYYTGFRTKTHFVSNNTALTVTKIIDTNINDKMFKKNTHKVIQDYLANTGVNKVTIAMFKTKDKNNKNKIDIKDTLIPLCYTNCKRKLAKHIPIDTTHLPNDFILLPNEKFKTTTLYIGDVGDKQYILLLKINNLVVADKLNYNGGKNGSSNKKSNS